VQFDETGKASLDHLYVQEDPRAYFGALRELDYCIPQLAKQYFAKLAQDFREARRLGEGERATVVDVGCSYGVNAALATCDATIDELYERYAGPEVAGLSRDELLTRDRAFVRSRTDLDAPRFVGLDASAPALAYAREAGLLAATVHADLEADGPTAGQRAVLGAADLVISTGCLGYVTERTIRRVAESAAGPLPWMAHFVLRMFPYAPVAESLAELGYETSHVEGVFKQRRFVSDEERALVLDSLADVGVDPTGLESDGWLYARLHISLPTDTKDHEGNR
jgi:SAM-dependent methyltransferase